MGTVRSLMNDLLSPSSLALLPLKACYFLMYTVVFTNLPYVSIISTRISTFEQLSLFYALGTVVSTVGPVFIGFIGDKIGNYKLIIIVTSLLAGFVHIPLLLLDPQPEEAVCNTTVNDSSLSTVERNLSSSTTTQSAYAVSLMFVIRLLGFVGIDGTLSLLDATGLAMSREFEGDFGRQKMWATLSITTVPLITGLIIDAISNELGYSDFTTAFYISAGAALAALPALLKLEIRVERNKASLLDSARKIIRMTDVVIFLFTEIVVGSCMGFHITYLSVFINKDLEGSSSLYGICLTCSGISGIIGFSLVKMIINCIGEVNTVAIGLLLYCARFIALSFIRFPWLILVSEIADGFCGFLAYAAGSYFCSAAAPSGLLASLNGILSACTFGIGKGLGTTVGSALIASFGMRATYCMFGVLAGITAIAYLFIHHTFLKKSEVQRESALPGELTGGTMSSTTNLQKTEEQVDKRSMG